MDLVDDKPTTIRGGKLSKKHFDPHLNIFVRHLKTAKDIASELGQTHVRDASTIMQVFTPIGPQIKIHIFSYMRLSWGVPSHAIYLESSCRVAVTPHLTCNTATYHFRDIRGQNFGFGGP